MFWMLSGKYFVLFTMKAKSLSLPQRQEQIPFMNKIWKENKCLNMDVTILSLNFLPLVATV